jgi:hypothetical protein
MWKLGLFILTIAVALGLGSTVLRSPLAEAASPFTDVIVGNSSSNPVPVAEQNVDANGDLKVHEQGTAAVSIQNTDSNGNVKVHEEGTANTAVTAYPQARNVHFEGGALESANSFEIDDQFAEINASTIVLSNLADGCQVNFQVGDPNGFVVFDVEVPAFQTITIPLPETVPINRVIARSLGAPCEANWTIVGS